MLANQPQHHRLIVGIGNHAGGELPSAALQQSLNAVNGYHGFRPLKSVSLCELILERLFLEMGLR